MRIMNIFIGILIASLVPAYASYQIANHSITQVKLAARATGTTVGIGGLALSLSSGNSWSTNSSTYVQVNNLSVTITTSGRPVQLLIQGDGTSNQCVIGSYNAGGASQNFTGSDFAFYRGASAISQYSLLLNTPVSGSSVISTQVPCGTLFYIDTPSAGIYTYYIYARRNAGTGTATYASIANGTLVAYEL